MKEWEKTRIARIRQFISDGVLTDQIFIDLKELVKGIERENFFLDEITKTQSRLSSHHHQDRQGLASYSDLTVTRNNIVNSISDITTRIEDHLKRVSSGLVIENSTNVVTGDIITSGDVFIGGRQVPNYLNQVPKQSEMQPTARKTTKIWGDFQIFIKSLREAYQVAVSLENRDLIEKGRNLLEMCKSDLEVYFNTPNDPGYNFYESCAKIAEYYKEVDEYKESFDKEWRLTIKNTLGFGQDYDALVNCIEILEQNVPSKRLTELSEYKVDLSPTSSVRLRTMVKDLILEIVNS